MRAKVEVTVGFQAFKIRVKFLVLAADRHERHGQIALDRLFADLLHFADAVAALCKNDGEFILVKPQFSAVERLVARHGKRFLADKKRHELEVILVESAAVES